MVLRMPYQRSLDTEKKVLFVKVKSFKLYSSFGLL